MYVCVCVLTLKLPSVVGLLSLLQTQTVLEPSCLYTGIHALHINTYDTPPPHAHTYKCYLTPKIRLCTVWRNQNTHTNTQKHDDKKNITYWTPIVPVFLIYTNGTKSLQREESNTTFDVFSQLECGTTTELHLPRTFLFIPLISSKETERRRATYVFFSVPLCCSGTTEIRGLQLGIPKELHIATCFTMSKLGHRQTGGQLQMCASVCVCLCRQLVTAESFRNGGNKNKTRL